MRLKVTIKLTLGKYPRTKSKTSWSQIPQNEYA